jgi:hypothetical protein
MSASSGVRPFRIDVPEAQLDDLRDRLKTDPLARRDR